MPGALARGNTLFRLDTIKLRLKCLLNEKHFVNIIRNLSMIIILENMNLVFLCRVEKFLPIVTLKHKFI